MKTYNKFCKIINILKKEYFNVDLCINCLLDLYNRYNKDTFNKDSELEFAKWINTIFIELDDPHLFYTPSSEVILNRYIPLGFRNYKCFYLNNNSSIEITTLNKHNILQLINSTGCSRVTHSYIWILTKLMLSHKHTIHLTFVDNTTLLIDMTDVPSLNKNFSLLSPNYYFCKIHEEFMIFRILTFNFSYTDNIFCEYINSAKFCKYLLLDLRGNFGGLLENCLFVTSLLIDKNYNYITIDRNKKSILNHIKPLCNSITFSKIFILVNEYTGSCCETLLIPALKNATNSTVITVGTNTAGFLNHAKKYTFVDHSSLSVTTHSFSDEDTKKMLDSAKPDINIIFTEMDTYSNITTILSKM